MTTCARREKVLLDIHVKLVQQLQLEFQAPQRVSRTDPGNVEPETVACLPRNVVVLTNFAGFITLKRV